MRSSGLLLSSLFLLGISLFATAQDSTTTSVASASSVPPVARDVQAVGYIHQSLAGSGSIAAAGRDVLEIGTITNLNDNTSQSITVRTSGTQYLRNEIGSEYVFLRAPTSGSMKLKGKPARVAGHILQYKRPDTIPTLLIVTEIDDLQTDCKFVGSEAVAGSPAYHIRLAIHPSSEEDPRLDDLLSETHVWIDQNTFQIVRSRTFLFSPESIENRSPVDTYYSDFRVVNGFRVPFHIVRFVDMQKDSEIVFNSIEVGVSNSPSDFTN